MRTLDMLRFASHSVRSGAMRTRLTALGIGVGIAAVVLLTAIGQGVHGFVLGQFSQFGTDVISVTPGQVRTHGVPGGIVGNVRPLSLADAQALEPISDVVAVMPTVPGNVQIDGNGKKRRVMVLGVNHAAPQIWNFRLANGMFLPRQQGAARALAVLGAKAKQQLFGTATALGQKIQIAGERYTVIGVCEPKGQILGFDLDDTVYVPVERTLAMFNRPGLAEIHVQSAPGADSARLVRAITSVLSSRHGREDFTVITQQQMLDTLGTVLEVLTVAVAALGGISLLVGGIGVLTIMSIAVRERVAEIGLLRALGAGTGEVLSLFLAEAVFLSGLGGVLGILLGGGAVLLLSLVAPQVPVALSWPYVLLAESVACGIGLVTGAVPAWRAASLDPIEALRAE